MAEPVLPPELERIIFELAAWNDKSTMRSLISVARRVRIWIQPLIHRVYIASNSASLSRLQTLVDEKPTLAEKHVLFVVLALRDFQRETIQRILSTCTNIIDLALWIPHTYPELLADMQPLTSLTHLSVDLLQLLGGEESDDSEDSMLPWTPARLLAPLNSVTHLDITSSGSQKLVDLLRSEALPALTHLGLGVRAYIAEFVTDILSIPERNDTLCVIVLSLDVIHNEEGAVSTVEGEIDDPRFCVVFCENFLDDWKTGSWGGHDFWARAEERVAERAALKSVDLPV
ncbi:hypothetical protein C8F01DRAFT_1294614 [Mycena amicta]|nr:hypothetical protein C8F01DRAFT_1294614 [Mycena amicta]